MRSYKAAYVLSNKRDWPERLVTIPDNLDEEPTIRRLSMDWMMKVFMGGWIPQGKRTQWASFAVALGAIVTAFVQWGSGSMDFVTLVKLVAEKWEIFAAAYATYFVAEKIDSKA